VPPARARVVAGALAVAVMAACAEPSALRVDDAVVRLSPMAHADHAASDDQTGETADATAYLTIHGGPIPDRLWAIRSEIAPVIELHGTEMDGAVARMTRSTGIDIPAGGDVRLEPAGHHAMLFGLHESVRAGDLVTLTLSFEQAGAVQVAAVVEAPSP
jgi:copper(I)-binding protein